MSKRNFWCNYCGTGTDENPPEHTQDCDRTLPGRIRYLESKLAAAEAVCEAAVSFLAVTDYTRSVELYKVIQAWRAAKGEVK